MNTIRICFAFTALLLFTTGAAAQSITPQQKAEVLRQLEGMSQSDIEDRISALGMSREEAEKRARENGIDLQTYLRSASAQTGGELPLLISGPSDTAVVSVSASAEKRRTVPTSRGLTYFGYDVFSATPAAFEPTASGPVDPEYIIGPEDVLRVSIWGQVEQQNELTVDKEGRIFIPSAGPVVVSGQTIDEINRTLTKQLSRSIQGLSSTPRSVWLDVTLAKVRPKRVFIMGEVTNPGGYTVNSYSTIFSSLFAVGGPTVNGSLREVRLIRDNKVVAKVDLYLYLTGAEKNTDVRVQNNDIIFVPTRKSTVYIRGDIRRPGVYELLPGEQLKKLTEYAGGYTPSSYLERVQVERIVPFKERVKNDLERRYIDINYRDILSKNRDYALSDGDMVSFYSVQDEVRNYVTVSGAVFKQGTYQYLPGMKVRDAVMLADSLRPESYDIRGEIVRFLEDNRTKTMLSFDVKAMMAGDPKHNIVLKPKDEVIIHSVDVSRLGPQFVEIFGKVKRPGRYVLTREMSLVDLLMLAGGFTEDASRLNAEIARLDDKVRNDTLITISMASIPDLADTLTITAYAYFEEYRAKDFVLKHRDQVFIRQNPAFITQQLVTINGEVGYPGIYSLISHTDYLSGLIERAGGLSSAGYLRGGKLTRKNNRVNVDFVDVMANPRTGEDIILHEGDLIEIPKRPNAVSVSGEINNPGLLGYIRGDGLWDYIDRAGGLTDSADYVILFHPNGNAEKFRTGIFGGNTEVYDGSSIVITKVPAPRSDERQLDIGNLIRDLFAIAASALTILVLSRQL